MRVISLGYFCSVAEELEKLGLRSESSPFDWVISDFPGVILAIRNRFEEILNLEHLYQSKTARGHYKNMKYGIAFFHDFSPYRTLQEQLPEVKEKYSRRIERFYKSITEPTLFVRYISDEQKINGISEELLWIEENLEYVLETVKQFNSENDILFIANDGVESAVIPIYHVPRAENDTVSRSPLHDNPDLLDKFQNMVFPERAQNLKRYQEKVCKKSRITSKIKSRVVNKYNSLFLKSYIHDQEY